MSGVDAEISPVMQGVDVPVQEQPVVEAALTALRKRRECAAGSTERIFVSRLLAAERGRRGTEAVLVLHWFLDGTRLGSMPSRSRDGGSARPCVQQNYHRLPGRSA